MFKEVWRPVVGFEGYYEVSSMGRVKSVSRLVKFCCGEVIIQPKIISTFTTKGGYLAVRLCYNSIQINRVIHRLVAMTFLPNPNNLPCVDHIDTNKKNNCVENLRWASYKENSNNPLTIEHHKASYTEDVIKRMKETRLKNNTKNKERKIYRFTKDGTYIDEFLGATAASKAVGVRPNTITTACLKGCASAGYLWTYDKNRVSKYRSQSERQMKKVYQYDNSGALIGEWNSVLEAVAKTGNKGISKAARNAGRLRAKGFFWSYEKVDNIFKNNPED